MIKDCYTTVTMKGINNDSTTGYTYGYDQLNRLLEMRQHTVSGNWSNSNILDAYRESIAYDANGNILKYLRHGANQPGRPLEMDSLNYKYNRNVHGRLVNNKLNYVTDQVNAEAYLPDIDNENPDNYRYDKIGNLILAMKLFLEYKRSTYPYHDIDHLADSRDWGNIKLIYYSGKQTFELFNIDWHLSPVLEWLKTNESKIKGEEFFYGSPDLSLAKRIDLARTANRGAFFGEVERENWRDRIFEFCDSNCLRMAFRGVEVPDIFVGINGGKQELSIYSSEQDIRLQVDLINFFDTISMLNRE